MSPREADAASGGGGAASRWGYRMPALLVFVVYAGMFLHGGGNWSSAGGEVLRIGTIPPATLEAFGSAIPSLVGGGRHERLLLEGWLVGSLLGCLLMVWWLAGTWPRLGRLCGGPVALVAALGAGFVGSAADVASRPDAAQALGAGPFLLALGLLGGQIAFALLARQRPERRAAGRSALWSSLLLLALHVFFTYEHRSGWALDPRLGDLAFLAATGTGAIVVAVLGGWLPQAPEKALRRRVPRAIATLLVAATATAGVVHVREAAADSERTLARTWLEALHEVEERGSALLRRGHRATDAERRRLGRQISAMAEAPPPLEHGSAPAALERYKETMSILVTGDIPDPHGLAVRLSRAREAWWTALGADAPSDLGARARRLRSSNPWQNR